ncbi:MAG: nitroreductase [Chlorobiaceae bacterium]|nr:nitroreductase [Chlorobiaceae bacterium]MBA4309037.1 nitroreductase [Chlorobiaceae bacterium]
MVALTLLQPANAENRKNLPSSEKVKLPEPNLKSNISIEETLLNRRSVRGFSDFPMTLKQVSQLLWAGQGITNPRGFRTAPSAGATFPLELYVVINNVDGVGKGVYKYNPKENEIIKVRDGDMLAELTESALQQTWVKEAAIIIVIAADYERTTGRYGERGIRYVHMEVGHVAQNISLQGVALNLSMTVIGAFRDAEIKKILNMPENENPLYIIPIGNK